jgi:N-acetylglucosamine-6-phosphate deacetylase
LDAAAGLTKVVTLAPERDPGYAVTKRLSNRGIIVSAGHCDPTLDELRGAIDAGLSMVTHLGISCPAITSRRDNVVERVLSLAQRLWICFMADGVHVPCDTLRGYLRLAGLDRSVVVTDATAAAGLGPGRYRLSRKEVVVGEDLAAWTPDRSRLVGAAITMPQLERNLHSKLGLPINECRRLLSVNPQRALARRS